MRFWVVGVGMSPNPCCSDPYATLASSNASGHV